MTGPAQPLPVVRVATRQLRPGMVLAEPVPAPGGDGVLLEQGTALHERAIALLTRREIAFVYVRNSASVRAQVTAAEKAEEYALRATLASDDTPEQSGSDNLLEAAREAVTAMVVTSADDRETAAAAWQGAHDYLVETQAGIEVRRRVDGGAALQQVEALLASLQRDVHPLVTLMHQRARHVEFDLAAHAVNVTILTLLIGLTMRLPDEELRHLFTVIASLIAPLIRLNILCEEKKHAIADPFASLAERLNRELGRAGKFNLPLAIALVRINKLSAYCTANSYPAGMALLDQLQEFFLPEVPSAESIIRFGLNSFAVIKDSREAKERMEAAVVRARAALPALAGLDVAVRVSAFPEHGAEAFALLDRLTGD